MKELPGCHLVIKDKNGNVVDEWTSSTIPHEIVAKLIAGETYTLIEIRPADGYSVARDIEFIGIQRRQRRYGGNV